MKDKLQATKELIDTQLELKYIEESCSPWNSIFVIGQDLGHKCLDIIVISDPVSRRPENLLPLISIYIWSGIFSYQ